MVCISSSSLVDMFRATLVTIRDQIKSGAIQRSRMLCEKVLEETKRRTEVSILQPRSSALLGIDL